MTRVLHSWRCAALLPGARRALAGAPLPRAPLPASQRGASRATPPRTRADARPRTPLTPERLAELVSPELRALDAVAIPPHFKKRSLALHVGYVGAPFRGNQSNPALPRGETVDDVLEDALFQAGHVALTNYRSPGLGRLAVRSLRLPARVGSGGLMRVCSADVHMRLCPPLAVVAQQSHR
jgi:hypothetical protein